MFDDDLVDEGGELEAVAGAELDRPAVDDKADLASLLLHAGEGNRVEVDGVRWLGRRYLLDCELDLRELVAPPPLEALHRVEDKIVEALGPAAVARDRGEGKRTAWSPAAAVSASACRVPAVWPRMPVQRSEHARSVDGAYGRGRASATRADRSANPGRGPGRGVASSAVRPVRRCSRAACGLPAVATLTYVYSDSTAVLGPLATYAEPHCYDLCARHSDRLTAPRGWEVIRLAPDPDALTPTHDDLEALANAVREAAQAPQDPEPVGVGFEVGRRGHLRVLRSEPDEPAG